MDSKHTKCFILLPRHLFSIKLKNINNQFQIYGQKFQATYIKAMTPRRSVEQIQSNNMKKENILMQMVKQKNWSKALSFLMTDYGRDIVTHQDEFNNTLLHIALGYRAPEEFLLKVIELYPEATQIKGVDDWLPLHVAAMWGCSANVMEAIIREYPEALDKAGEKGRTPRHFSERFAHNKELLQRTTAEWLSLTLVKRKKMEIEKSS
jgi:hypothetical protein